MRKRWWIIGLAIVILAGMGYVGFGAFQRMSGRQAQAQSTTDETAVVGRGTLRVTIDGSGSLAPNDEVALAFPSAGRVAEVLAAVGDRLVVCQASFFV